ncbi:hypothetical protein QWJ90_06285 [Microbacterium oryzae]|uniref:hypothetical protein n=1 Tax=Microbacterium oryzae TaxID=743009 RepID=UPI0025B1E152|nr:hypothetical protein [Microbacterium oryzae]MDN3310532.1 hypothetical protein [Microbacterium oryzae]
MFDHFRKNCRMLKATRLTSLATVVLAAAALAGCTASPAPATTTAPAAEQTSEASPTPAGEAESAPEATSAPDATEPEECKGMKAITFGRMSASLIGERKDQGARQFAEGEVSLDADGNVVSYTVAPGDVGEVIGERLCIRNGGDLGVLNHVRTIQPGQVLWLNPNPDVPWVPYYQPPEFPEGFQQIPYQQAIEAMGAAVDAGNLDTMRAIWANELSAMFTNQQDKDVISRELETGDLDRLRQMFS